MITSESVGACSTLPCLNCSYADFKAVEALYISRNVKSNFCCLVKEETKKNRVYEEKEKKVKKQNRSVEDGKLDVRISCSKCT